MKARIAKPGGYLEIDLADVLTRVSEYFEKRCDVVDGDYGVPEANEELRLYTDVEDALEAFCNAK